MRNRLPLQALLAAAGVSALFGASPAWAERVFKSTMPDGKVIYGEKPAPGAARVETLEPPPAKSGISGLTPEEKARAEALARQRAATEAAAADARRALTEARKQLEQAQAAQSAGREPLPGERIGIVGGGTRLTEAYETRQKALHEAVVAARKRVETLERAAR